MSYNPFQSRYKGKGTIATQPDATYVRTLATYGGAMPTCLLFINGRRRMATWGGTGNSPPGFTPHFPPMGGGPG